MSGTAKRVSTSNSQSKKVRQVGKAVEKPGDDYQVDNNEEEEEDEAAFDEEAPAASVRGQNQ